MTVRGRWLSTMALAVLLAACGGSAGPGSDPTATSTAAATPDGSGGGGGGGGGEDGPVTVFVDGATHGYGVGTCDISDADNLYADAAMGTTSFASVNVRITDAGGAQLRAIVPTGEGAPPLQLFAGDQRPETSWTVRVDGSAAEIDARMFDESPEAGDDPFHDVRITIRCDERGFGGMAPGPTLEPAPAEPTPGAPEPTPTGAGSTITVVIDTTTYVFEYAGCPLTEPVLNLLATDASLNRLLLARGGELRVATQDGVTWSASGVQVGQPSGAAAWSGMVSTPDGTTAPATVAIACP